jgi:SAM-dependent methyltransferase
VEKIGDKAGSFGRVAETYDRARPGPAPAAVDWLIPAGCRAAVDLAAGTGLFTRALLDRVPDITAVEPDGRMRAVLAQRTGGVRVLDGRGEAIPLPDASADGVFVSTAWHWLDPALAIPEIARVLRDGGRLGVIWTSRDRADDWVAELDLLRLSAVPGEAREREAGGEREAGEPCTADQVREELDRHHSVTLPPDAAFGRAEAASFTFTRIMEIDDVIDWLATNSAFITAPPARREKVLARCRATLLPHATGDSRVEIPLRSWCWRADRLPRGTELRLPAPTTVVLTRPADGARKSVPRTPPASSCTPVLSCSHSRAIPMVPSWLPQCRTPTVTTPAAA